MAILVKGKTTSRDYEVLDNIIAELVQCAALGRNFDVFFDGTEQKLLFAANGELACLPYEFRAVPVTVCGFDTKGRDETLYEKLAAVVERHAPSFSRSPVAATLY